MYTNEQAGDLWDAQAPYGYKTGIAIALHLPGGKHFVMGVDRYKALPANDMVIAQMMADLLLLAVHAQARWARLSGPESGARCARACSPWSAPFPPRPPPPVPGPCSVASAVLRSGPTSHARPSSPFVVRLHDAALVCAKASTGPPGSRARCVRACSGSQTAQGSRPSCVSDGPDMAFRLFRQRRHPGGEEDFAAQYPAHACPCQRFTGVLANARRMTRSTMWLARPSSSGSFSHNISPVSTGAPKSL